MEQAIKIYNSLERRKQPFTPLNPKEVKMYVCGPTVYDEPHIGHARSAYIFDTIRKYLIYKGYKVKFVRNVTDVDDKIIDKARNEFKGEDLKSACKKVADKYLKAYHDALDILGITSSSPNVIEPKASEYIDKMKDLINNLIKKGVAYQAGGDVYFDITKANDYGKLSNQSLEKMDAGARVLPTENKKNPLDFALWKSAKENEPSWDSPWGKGRPGWHIECSVMSSGILGDEFDIHGGGLDLIFPHHENEIAQSEGAGKKFARYWIHHGLLTINGQKMAKSLGNFVTIKDFVEQNSSLKLKLFFVSAHYHSPLDYNDTAIHIASENLETLGLFFRKIKDYDKGGRVYDEAKDFKQRFINAMDDDFNTPVALSVLLKMVSAGYKNINQNNIDEAISICNTLEDLLNILNLDEIKKIYQGFVTSEEIVNALVNLEQKYKDKFAKYGLKSIIITNKGDELGNQKKLIEFYINFRNLVKHAGDFELADQIRNDLFKEAMVILEDIKSGTTWRIKI